MLRIPLIAAIACAALSTAPTQAQTIFVDRNASAAGGNGSHAAPYRTITRALGHARVLRFGSNGQGGSNDLIKVVVASGEYVGTFDPANSNPDLETLPLLLNVPEFRLEGQTSLLTAGGLPVSAAAGATVLRASTAQLLKQHLVVITRTVPKPGSGYPATQLMLGDHVTIRGFTFDGLAADGTRPTAAMSSTLISVDGVADFDIRENHIVRAGTFGISTRLASGRIQRNLVVQGLGVGFNLTGGSEVFPAELFVHRNRVDGGNLATGGIGLNGAAQTENDRADLFEAHSFRRDPLPAFYDPANHPESVPDRLEAHVIGNDVSNAIWGIRLDGFVRDQYKLQPSDQSPLTARVEAQLTANVSRSNRDFGLLVDAAQIATSDPRKYVINIGLSVQNMVLEANGHPAYFGFWRLATAVNAMPAQDLSFKFAHDSRIDVCGDIGQFTFDNRSVDPTSGTPTNNTLTVNASQFLGTCVPLAGCFVTAPRRSGCNGLQGPAS